MHNANPYKEFPDVSKEILSIFQNRNFIIKTSKESRYKLKNMEDSL